MANLFGTNFVAWKFTDFIFHDRYQSYGNYPSAFSSAPNTYICELELTPHLHLHQSESCGSKATCMTLY